MLRRWSFLVLLATTPAAAADRSPHAALLAVAKVYGAAGSAGLEGYQTGLFVGDSAVLTVDSPVLEFDAATVIDAYGDRCEARLVGRDAATGLALLACPPSTIPPAVLTDAAMSPPPIASAAWVLSNAFGIAEGDEPVSVQRGRLSAVAAIPLAGEGPGAAAPRPGVPLLGSSVLLLDIVTSNPGTPGGAVVDRHGAWLGVVGAECRSPLTGAWINYAVPAAEARAAIDRMLANGTGAGTSGPRSPATPWRARLRGRGLILVPALTSRTPAYIEHAEDGSLAAQVGLRPDDLIVSVEGATVGDVESVGALIVQRLRGGEACTLSVLRGSELLTFTLAEGAP